MSDPKRLLDGGGNELEVALLKSARQDGPSAGARQRALVALGIGTGAAVLSAKATAAAGATAAARGTTLSLLKWVGIGVLGGAATVGIAQTVTTAAPHETVPIAPASVSVREMPRAAAPVTALQPSASAPTPAASAPIRMFVPAVDPPVESARPTLADEVAALDRAREAVAAGQPARALSVLDDYGRRFPGGTLAQEATVLRIEALAASGDKAGASRLGQGFLEKNPGSPHAARIRTLIGASPIP
jgi:TolA-binding protein